jgi:hypothetical protein
MNKQRFARQILMFGEEGQAKIEAQKAGVVGAGGLGSQIFQALAYTGVRKAGVIDDDRLDDTNMNRVAGAFPPDVGRLKVDVARDGFRAQRYSRERGSDGVHRDDYGHSRACPPSHLQGNAWRDDQQRRQAQTGLLYVRYLWQRRAGEHLALSAAVAHACGVPFFAKANARACVKPGVLNASVSVP